MKPYLRLGVLLGVPVLVFWLGHDAIERISALYDGLCVLQGPGMASLLSNDNPQGYCTGIGSDLGVLHVITTLCAISMPAVLLAIWRHLERK